MLLNRAWHIQRLIPALTVFPAAFGHEVKDGLENLLVSADKTQPGDCKLSVCMCVFPHIRAGWVDCWSVPNFLLIIDYTWHPIYPQKADEQLKQSCKLAASLVCCYPLLCKPLTYIDTVDFLTIPFWCCYQYIFCFLVQHDAYMLLYMCFVCEVSEMEESMLSALRPPEHTTVPPRYTSASTSAAHPRLSTDPSELPPDRLHVEMEMSPDSQIILYGPLLRALISIKVQKSLIKAYNRNMDVHFDEWSWRYSI